MGSNADITPVASTHPAAAMARDDVRTLETIFRHPTAYNLEWSDVTSLFRYCGSAEQGSHGEFTFRVGSEHQTIGSHHGKQLGAAEVIDLRHLLAQSGWGPDRCPIEPASHVAQDLPTLLVTVDHHEARIYRVHDRSPESSAPGEASATVIRPHDPHHFVHHLVHHDQSRERGQRAPEDPDFYGRIAQVLASAGRIVLIGHGTGKSNAAQHLARYLRLRHVETSARVSTEIVEDLSSVTAPQLLQIAERSTI